MHVSVYICGMRGYVTARKNMRGISLCVCVGHIRILYTGIYGYVGYVLICIWYV